VAMIGLPSSLAEIGS